MKFEKVNPMHPDKIADRIAGALIDLAYKLNENPKVAVEVLIGHNECNIITESNVLFDKSDVLNIITRITKVENVKLNLKQNHQDVNLARNQENGLHSGDNGIFKGVKTSNEEKFLTNIAKEIYNKFNSDGKYIYDSDENKLIICQSNAKTEDIENLIRDLGFNGTLVINPIGDWVGGINVDCGATNRKLGSDMGRGVTGGGLHGKDLSKADVAVNIYAYLKAEEINDDVNLACAIGDKFIDGKSYDEIFNITKKYIDSIGGFEKLAEWGLIR